MQAVILAAGHGRRLRPHTADRTKGMVELHGRPLLARSLDALVETGIDRIVLVVGYCQAGVREAWGEEYRGVPVVYVENLEHATTNNIHSLHLARDLLCEDDTLLLESDVIFEPALLADLVAHPAPDVAVVDAYRSWMDGTAVTVGPDDRITSVVPGVVFRPDDVARYFKTVNIYKFSAAYLRDTYVPFLDAYVRVMGRSAYYEQVLRVLTTLDRQHLVAMRATRRWYEIDDEQDLQNAATVFAEPGTRHHAYAGRHGGLWRFPDVIDHCLLVNPFYPPPALVAELQQAVPEVVLRYPSGAAIQSALAARMLGLEARHVVVGNGASELIVALGTVLAAQRDRGQIVIPRPTFEEWPARLGSAAEIVVVEGAGGADALVAAAAPGGVVVLVNPDNPTGACLRTDDVRDLARRLWARGARLLLDESFVDFADPDHCRSLLSPADLTSMPGLVVVRSISKSHGVPGLRLGVLATADDALLAAVRAALPVWNVGSLAEAFMQIVTSYEADYAAACTRLRRERDRWSADLASLPEVDALPSHASYITVRLTGPHLALDVANRLLERHGLLVKVLTGKPGLAGEWLRLAVRTAEEDDRLTEALRAELAH